MNSLQEIGAIGRRRRGCFGDSLTLSRTEYDHRATKPAGFSVPRVRANGDKCRSDPKCRQSGSE